MQIKKGMILMTKKIIISIALFITALSSIGYVSYKKLDLNHSEINKSNIKEENKEVIFNEEDNEATEQPSSQIESNEEEKTVEKNEKQEENSSKSSSENSKAVSKAESKTTTTKTETATPKKEETTKSDDRGVIDSQGNNQAIENKKIVDKEPWEKLGISKNDYYSKPSYSWARVDYPISKCSSIENCESLCMKDAEELAYTENVSCIQIFTYSGTYLGEMLKRD